MNVRDDEATTSLLHDALAISAHWLGEVDLRRRCEEQLDQLRLLEGTLDVVAIGKASREMADAVASILGDRLLRRFVVGDVAGSAEGDDALIGEHPRPGEGSLRAGESLLAFLGQPSDADATLFLISGGASSLCVLPVAPVTLDDLALVFDASVSSGADITTLNKVRASVSVIAGGGVLRYVRTPRSASLILVDNVVSGARWVASGLTYDYRPPREEVTALLALVGLTGSPLGERLLEGSQRRVGLLMGTASTVHENVVLAEPSLILDDALEEARRRGYAVHDLGAAVQGDVRDVVASWIEVVRQAAASGEPSALVGVGEVTVSVRGEGRGGRCQEFAWLMARELEGLAHQAVFLARASDGRDFVEGAAGAWVDTATMERSRSLGIDWATVAATNDSNPALHSLGQVIEGGHTGWNLCDLYLVVVSA